MNKKAPKQNDITRKDLIMESVRVNIFYILTVAIPLIIIGIGIYGAIGLFFTPIDEGGYNVPCYDAQDNIIEGLQCTKAPESHLIKIILVIFWLILSVLISIMVWNLMYMGEL